MLDLGRFPYKNAADSDKVVTSLTVSKGTPLNLDVEFNNTGDSNITLDFSATTPATASYKIVDNATGTATTTPFSLTGEKVVLKGKSLALGNINDTMSTAGSFTIIVEVNDGTKKYESEFVVTVKNTDATVSGIKVKDVVAIADSTDLTGKTYDVALPFGTDLTKLVASDVKVTATDKKAAVGTATIVLGTETPTVQTATITVDVTAEDGKAKATYTINVTLAPASNQAGITHLELDGTLYAVSSTLNNQTTATSGTAITDTINLPAGVELPETVKVKVADTTAEASAVTLDTTTTTGSVIAKFTVTAQDGTAVEYEVTITPAP